MPVELADKSLKEGKAGQPEEISMDCVLIIKAHAAKRDSFALMD